jgi:hypothetical protein
MIEYQAASHSSFASDHKMSTKTDRETHNHERRKTREELKCRKEMKRLAATRELQIFRQQLERNQHFLFYAPAPSCMAPNVFPASAHKIFWWPNLKMIYTYRPSNNSAQKINNHEKLP